MQMKRPFIAAAFGLALTSAHSASGADLAKKPTPPAPAETVAACKETKESALPPDVFGFGAGSDVADPGSLAAGLEYGGGFGERGRRFSTHSLKAQLSYGLLPCLEVGPSLNTGMANGRDRFSPISDRTSVFGGQVEFKYKLLGRATHGLGLTLVTEPGYSVFNARLKDPLTPFVGSERSHGFSNTYKALTDFAIVPDKLFGALSVEFAHAYTSREPLGLAGCATNGISSGGYCRSSNLNFRAALAYKAADPFFVGAEVQYLSAYDGAFLNRFAGSAVFVGPTFFWEIVPGKVAVNAAWATQVSGKARGVPGNLDTTNFSQHIAKAKLAFTF
jgi:hypothetical protein